MRGARIRKAGDASWPGIIPADAGSTMKLDTMPSVIWDHPRGCGEHVSTTLRVAALVGSSPRMRGAHRCEHPGRHNRRIIPADAGSTRNAWPHQSGPGDHPRGCGEHAAPGQGHGRVPGSSPRMRGALSQVERRRRHARIIPADAGSTPGSTSPPMSTGDHPRGCGEHYGWAGGVDLSEGSSPRMRGALSWMMAM